MERTVFQERVDVLAETWRTWSELGAALSDRQWETPSRCEGWTVANLFAHHSLSPLSMAGPPPPPADGISVTSLSAADVLKGFNRPGGVAHRMAKPVAGHAVAEAQRVSRSELVERFSAIAPATVAGLRHADPDLLIAWPATDGYVPLSEALRIVLMEATVHLLDVLRALDRAPAVPEKAVRESVALLSELADPVDFVEAASGRTTVSPLPVLR
jgi:uncharacterized protein (TIGR03083 family)